MTDRQTTDVIVVGAGIAGVSCAFHLAGLGIKTTLIEQRHPAAGPTGLSSAICHAAYLSPELSRLAARGIEILRDIPALTGGPPCYSKVGMLWVFGEDAAPAWRAAVNRMKGDGIEIEAVSTEAFRRLAPRFNPERIALGVWEPHGGYADPYGAANSLANGARARGAVVHLNTLVSQFILAGSRIAGIKTADGKVISADTVVLATGVWTRPLVAQLGVDLPIHVERHGMAVLDAPGIARDILPFCWCDDIFCNYARPEGDSSILVGAWSGGGTGARHESAARPPSVSNPEVYETVVDLEESAEILECITPRAPELAALGVRRGYAGLYDMSPDDNPIIDRIPGTENAFVVCGSSGHGFKIGPAVGEEVARWVSTGQSQWLNPFRLSRFPGFGMLGDLPKD